MAVNAACTDDGGGGCRQLYKTIVANLGAVAVYAYDF